MKKLLYTFLLFAAVMTSCNLDKMPKGAIITQDAITSVNDAANFREYLYIRLRGVYSGSPIYTMEISTDIFNSSIGFGNRGGEYFNWEWNSESSLIKSLWGYCYYNIAVCNFLIEGIDQLDKTEMSDADKALLAQYQGEAEFLKAFSTFMLVERYCEVYDASNASTQLGVMLMNSYQPTSDQSKYPGRSSLADTYTYIESCITRAETALASIQNNEGSIYLTPDAITAFKARVALAKGDFNTAITNSTTLVDSGRYPLINTQDDFLALWKNDSGKECIMQLWADYAASSLPSSNAYNYYGESAAGTFSPDYIPEQWVIDLYEPDDIRYTTWFTGEKLTYGSLTGQATLCNKFMGNPALQSSSNTLSDYINKIKPFRIAEQYLIAAEAYARLGNNDGAARQYLNALKSKRIATYEGDPNLSGAALLAEIKSERVRELIGEGFRFTDLKRWEEGFTRSTAQNPNIISSKGADLSVASSNFRFLWPIPQSEMDANPQMNGQQNLGY